MRLSSAGSSTGQFPDPPGGGDGSGGDGSTHPDARQARLHPGLRPAAEACWCAAATSLPRRAWPTSRWCWSACSRRPSARPAANAAPEADADTTVQQVTPERPSSEAEPAARTRPGRPAPPRRVPRRPRPRPSRRPRRRAASASAPPSASAKPTKKPKTQGPEDARAAQDVRSRGRVAVAERRRFGSRPSRVLTVVLASMFVLVLVVAGIANARGGNDAAGERPEGDTSNVPQFVSDGGPIVDTTARQGDAPPQVPRGTIVLTFDDGPDPEWTPAGPGRAQEARRPGDVLRGRRRTSPATPTSCAAIHDAGLRAGRALVLPPRPRARSPGGASTASWPRRSWRSPAPRASRTFLAAPAVLLERRRDRQPRLEHRAGRGRGRLRHASSPPTTARTGSGRASTRSSATRRPSRTTRRARSCSCTTRAATGPRPWRRWTSCIPLMKAKGYTFTTVSGRVEGPGRPRSPPRRTTASPAACSWPP